MIKNYTLTFDFEELQEIVATFDDAARNIETILILLNERNNPDDIEFVLCAALDAKLLQDNRELFLSRLDLDADILAKFFPSSAQLQ